MSISSFKYEELVFDLVNKQIVGEFCCHMKVLSDTVLKGLLFLLSCNNATTLKIRNLGQ